MKLLPYPITKILLPYDGSPSARNALELAGQLSMAGKEAVTGVTLLQVIGGGYLARHVQNVDLRVTRMDKDKDWQRIRKRYLDEEIIPCWRKGKKSSSHWALSPHRGPHRGRQSQRRDYPPGPGRSLFHHHHGPERTVIPQGPAPGERHPQRPIAGGESDGLCSRSGGRIQRPVVQFLPYCCP